MRLGQPPVKAAYSGLAAQGPVAIQGALPARLGPYRLVRALGTGGMGVVHLAVGQDGRQVAVKAARLPAAGKAEARRRLDREVEAMRRVHSPFVTEVTDADLSGEIPYIVTRFVPGPTLGQVVAEQGPLRGRALQRLAYGLAEALAAVHAAGIVHRDLKPGNVMMDGDAPVLIDFGIAYQAGDEPLTEPGTCFGTPGYLAPEVIEGQRARAPADVHAWGTTVGFAARGEPLYGEGSYETVFSRIVRADANLDGIHGALYPLVAAALLRQPDQRPTAAWLARQLVGLDLEVPVPPPTSLPPSLAGYGPRAGLETSRPEAPARQEQAWQEQARQEQAGQEIARQRPAEVSGLLRAGRDTQIFNALAPASCAARPRRHRVIAFATLVAAVGASLILPVAATLAVAGLLTLLRTADRARRGPAARRIAHSPRARDLLLFTGSIPWALARSVIETTLIAPFLLAAAWLAAAGVAAAGVAAAGGTAAHHSAHMLSAWALVAAAYTILSCVGPRSRPARRELNRVFNVLDSAPLTVAMTLLTAAVLATMITSPALVKTPSLWPFPGLHTIHVHAPDLRPASLHQ